MSYGEIEQFEDITVFTFNEFSTIATVISATSSLIEITGIFDINYSPMFDESRFSLETLEGRNISFLVESALIGDLHHRDVLKIKGNNYFIVGIQPLDDGKITNLILKEQIS